VLTGAPPPVGVPLTAIRLGLSPMHVPDELRYSSDHEWARVEGNTVRVGITDYAQDALGDVVYVEVPEVGAAVAANDKISEVESTKSVSDIYAPVGGTIAAVNADLGESPQRLNEDPYGEGWICVIELGGDDGLDALLDPEAYRKLIEA
jgi:glycine cleavage system H protein